MWIDSRGARTRHEHQQLGGRPVGAAAASDGGLLLVQDGSGARTPAMDLGAVIEELSGSGMNGKLRNSWRFMVADATGLSMAGS
jgi:hypothetical protein